MGSEMYVEYRMMPLREVIVLCARCKDGIVFFSGSSHLCYKCGCDEPGLPFVRADRVRTMLVQQRGPKISKQIVARFGRWVTERLGYPTIIPTQYKGSS